MYDPADWREVRHPGGRSAFTCNKPVDEEEMIGSGEPKKKLKGNDCFITQCKFKGRRHEDYLRHIGYLNCKKTLKSY